MAKQAPETDSPIRFAADETPPFPLAAVVGLQTVVLILAGIALTPIIVARTAGVAPDWLLFAAFLVCGVTTILQARPLWIFGCGYVLFMGSNGAYLGVAADAVAAGGLALLMTLTVVSGPAQLLFSFRLGQLREVVTPAVGGVVVMLIAVSIVPIAFGLMTRPIPDVEMLGQQATAFATFAAIVLLVLFADQRLRLWAPLIGVGIGTLVAAWWGMVDLAPVSAARWIGLPTQAHPGLDLSFGHAFWALLPAFVLVTVVGGIETFGDGVAVQKVSNRAGRAISFRSVQGAINADGLGNTLSGLAGTVPNTVYSTSVAVVEITGVASRSVGLWGGAFLILLAFMPKVAAALAAIPNPVAGAYIFVLLILLFSHGVRLITEEGVSFAEGFAVCTSFWVGVAVQNKLVFHESLPLWFTTIFGNGTTAGGAAAILLMLLLRLGSGRRRTVTLRLDDPGGSQRLEEMLRAAGAASGWEAMATARLVLVGEAALACLREGMSAADHARPVLATLRRRGTMAELELACRPLSRNLGDRLGEAGAALPEHLDTITGLADGLEHRQFQGRDYLLVKVPVAGFVRLEPAGATAPQSARS
ncbi:MAG: uracil-xanthine permease family protein [Geminicoccaceae bacterium]